MKEKERERHRKASENISKIFNPDNKYKRTQKKILKDIFK